MRIFKELLMPNPTAMPTITYFSLKKLYIRVVQTFREFIAEERATQSPILEDQEDQTRAKFKVSVNDLKVISSALLYYKKFLVKRKDFEKAEVVTEVDDRIYRLILSLEKEAEEMLDKAEEMAA